MSGHPKDPVAARYSRIYEVTGTRTQTELAEWLGIAQSAISTAMRNGTIPDSWLLTLLRKASINPRWILTGQGAMRLVPEKTLEETLKAIPLQDLMREAGIRMEEILHSGHLHTIFVNGQPSFRKWWKKNAPF